MRYELNIKPEICPECGSSRISNILYGKPKSSPELTERVRIGEIVYGGCNLVDDRPSWKCFTCSTYIHRKRQIVSV